MTDAAAPGPAAPGPAAPDRAAPPSRRVDDLEVRVLASGRALGREAAERAAGAIRRAVDERGEARVVFAAPPSQDAFLQALRDLELACIGIGENGHLAFDDPPVADFEDPKRVKVVDLDAACRRQQVHDGAFASQERVPQRTITLTIPSILGAREIVCVVPGARKRAAVRAALYGPIAPACPASALRRHPRATLLLDEATGAASDERSEA